jgi:hypothetical protein
VPTVPVTIGGVAAPEQLDTGYDDRLIPHSINVNAALLAELQAAFPNHLFRKPASDVYLVGAREVTNDGNVSRMRATTLLAVLPAGLAISGCGQMIRDAAVTQPATPARHRVLLAWQEPPEREPELAQRFERRVVELLRSSKDVGEVEHAAGAFPADSACAAAARLGVDVVIVMSVLTPAPEPALRCAEREDEPGGPLEVVAYGLCATVGLGLAQGLGRYCDDIVATRSRCSKWAPDGRMVAERAVRFRRARVYTRPVLGRWCVMPDGWAIADRAAADDGASAIRAARAKVKSRLDALTDSDVVFLLPHR